VFITSAGANNMAQKQRHLASLKSILMEILISSKMFFPDTSRQHEIAIFAHINFQLHLPVI